MTPQKALHCENFHTKYKFLQQTETSEFVNIYKAKIKIIGGNTTFTLVWKEKIAFMKGH